jgi:hypothetical protein
MAAWGKAARMARSAGVNSKKSPSFNARKIAIFWIGDAAI